MKSVDNMEDNEIAEHRYRFFTERSISTADVSQRLWGHDLDSFVEQFIEFMAPQEDPET